ncbi:MAG: hypothetical protein PHI32_09345 [Dysgonamonadaceae bacterium]|nr:hypothetical protein [Dysgonamonadaceae bacterium]
MGESIDEMFMKMPKTLKMFLFSGRQAEIDVFFSMNCLKELNDYYEQSSDYRLAFARIAFYMYQETEGAGPRKTLEENDFVSASDEELEALLISILQTDERLNKVYEQTQAVNPFERFYKANDNLVKSAVSPVVKTLSKISKAINVSSSTAIRNVFEEHNAFMRSIDFPHIRKMQELSEIYNKVNLSHITEAFRYTEQLRGLDLSYLIAIPKFDYPEIRSALDKVSQIGFNIAEIVKPFELQMAQFQTDFYKQMQSMFSAITDFMSSIDFSMLTYHHQWSEKHDLLVKFGWFYLNELSTEVIDEIYDKRDSITQDEVDRLVVQDFRKNRCERLKKIVKKWNDSPYFKPRKLVLHQALVNHSRRCYNASTTLLSIHTEGIITDFMRLGLQAPKFRVQGAINDITEYLNVQPMSSLSFSDWQIYSEVLERILSAFVEHFDCANPDGTSNDSRHKIAHGHATEAETEVNSLKRFLYLNEVYRLLSYLDKCIQEKNEQ